MTDRTYKQEFPDYDYEIPAIPGLVDHSWHNDAMPCFENEALGIRVWFDYKDPTLSREPIDVARKEGTAFRFAMDRITDPVDGSKDVSVFETDDVDEFHKAYADLWMKLAAVHIGTGFHPDTPSEDYNLPLDPPALHEQYDEMISFCHTWLDDPYATGLQAWVDAGLVEYGDDDSAVTPGV